MTTESSFGSSSITEWDSDDELSLLEDLALYEDPPLTFLQAFLPSADLLLFLLRRSSARSLVKMGIVYLVLGMASFSKPGHALLRFVWLAALAVPTLFMFMAVLFMAHIFVSKRQDAFESARNQLWERIQDGRALRKDGYDIYLPSTSHANKYGIILFPGALINHTAYASLAAKLSDKGILVVVMSYGPSLLTMNVSECEKRAQLAMDDVAYELEYLGLDEDVPVQEWVLAGHSLGATLALNAATNMDSVHKVILCGVGRDAMGVSSDLRSSNKQVLVVNGSNDPFVTDCTEEQKTDFQNCLPQGCEDKSTTTKARTTFVTIDGGNHAGFAHYGPQTYPKLDGERTLSIDEQQEQFVQRTLELLNIPQNNKFQS